ncbi:MAG: metalloregulator ArsR/SmtB family transcription factor [Candidatus Omnitrophota bacterium]
MKIRKARQILKSLADDTRLRIINLLKKRQLTVGQMCRILEKKQSNMSKHLARLRLTEIVNDKRKGNNVYYYLSKPANKPHKELLNALLKGLADVEIFKEDILKMEGTFKKSKQEEK